MHVLCEIFFCYTKYFEYFRTDIPYIFKLRLTEAVVDQGSTTVYTVLSFFFNSRCFCFVHELLQECTELKIYFCKMSVTVKSQRFVILLPNESDVFEMWVNLHIFYTYDNVG
jgi:hypothetical protein